MVTKALMLDETGKEMVESLDRIAEALTPSEETVEGNPITFDSPFEQDAKSVVVSVKPIQDLHGLPFPYVGGAYKNKLPLVLADIKAINTSGTWSGNTYTKDGMSYTVLVDDGNNVVGILVYGETSVNTSLNLPLFSLPTGTYIVSVGALRSRLNKNGSQIADISANQSYTLTVDNNSDEYILYLYPGATSISNVTVYPMIRLATESDATFAPYSNICPISGIDEVEIPVTGKNQFDNSAVTLNSSISTSNGTVYPTENYDLSDYIRVGGSSLIISGDNNDKSIAFGFYDADKRWFASANGYVNSPISIPNGAYYVRFDVHKNRGNIQCELGSTPTEYEPYKGSTSTIPLPSTLYDADVDVTNGRAPENGGFAVFDGSNDEHWAEGLVEGAYSLPKNVITNAYIPRSSHDFITDKFKVADQNTFVLGTIWAGGDYLNVVIKNMFPTLTEFKNYLANNPLQIKYPLNVPTTVSFDPTDVELLEGTNVVTTNGESVKLTYGKSFAQAIDEIETAVAEKLNRSDVADVEGDTASKAYSVNDFMLRADGFYKVTQPIAQNASITASNTTKTTIGAVLTALLNS